MALRFRGEFNQKVDAKGRMSIPARFRRVLETGDPDYPEINGQASVVLLYGDHLTDCMHAYTVEAFREIEDEILAMPRGSEQRRLLSRLVLGQSLDAEVDKDGRVVIPKEQRDKYSLSGDTVFIGMGDHFEIWPAETFEAKEGVFARDFLERQEGSFDPLSLLQGGS